MPNSQPQAQSGSPATKAFGDCLLSEGRNGFYATTGPQFEGGKSVFRLMAQCKPQWDAWMDECEANRGVNGGCSAKSYLIAYGALKTLGK